MWLRFVATCSLEQGEPGGHRQSGDGRSGEDGGQAGSSWHGARQGDARDQRVWAAVSARNPFTPPCSLVGAAAAGLGCAAVSSPGQWLRSASRL